MLKKVKAGACAFARVLLVFTAEENTMATGEFTRERMIAFIREKDEFYKSVDLTALTAEELTVLWETVRATWLLGQEKKRRAEEDNKSGDC